MNYQVEVDSGVAAWISFCPAATDETGGYYPALMKALLGTHVPPGWKWGLGRLAQRLGHGDPLGPQVEAAQEWVTRELTALVKLRWQLGILGDK